MKNISTTEYKCAMQINRMKCTTTIPENNNSSVGTDLLK